MGWETTALVCSLDWTLLSLSLLPDVLLVSVFASCIGVFSVLCIDSFRITRTIGEVLIDACILRTSNTTAFVLAVNFLDVFSSIEEGEELLYFDRLPNICFCTIYVFPLLES